MTRRQTLTTGLILLTAILNGCTIGYDETMMNNLNITKRYVSDFNLDTNLLGLNVAILNAGSIFGALSSGYICDKFGLRWAACISVFYTIVAVVLQTVSLNEGVFCFGRFFIGMAINLTGTAVPALVIELAPPKYRAMMGALYSSIFYFPSLIVSGLSYSIHNADSSWAWRGVCVGQVVAPLLSLPLIFYLPESPRWLISKGRPEKALQVLKTLHGDENETIHVESKETGDVNSALNDAVVVQFNAMMKSVQEDRAQNGEWRSLVYPRRNLHQFLVAVGLFFFTQLTGVTTAAFYLGKFLDSAGVTDNMTQFKVTIVMNAWNLVCCVVGAITVEWAGRKVKLMSFMVFSIICLVIVGCLVGIYGGQAGHSVSYATVAVIFLLSGAFNLLWMPLIYLYAVEVLSYSQRAKGIAVAQAANCVSGLINQYTTPIALQNIGWRFYAVNASWNVVICGIIALYFIETRGRPLS